MATKEKLKKALSSIDDAQTHLLSIQQIKKAHDSATYAIGDLDDAIEQIKSVIEDLSQIDC